MAGHSTQAPNQSKKAPDAIQTQLVATAKRNAHGEPATAGAREAMRRKSAVTLRLLPERDRVNRPFGPKGFTGFVSGKAAAIGAWTPPLHLSPQRRQTWRPRS